MPLDILIFPVFQCLKGDAVHTDACEIRRKLPCGLQAEAQVGDPLFPRAGHHEPIRAVWLSSKRRSLRERVHAVLLMSDCCAG